MIVRMVSVGQETLVFILMTAQVFYLTRVALIMENWQIGNDLVNAFGGKSVGFPYLHLKNCSFLLSGVNHGVLWVYINDLLALDLFNCF